MSLLASVVSGRKLRPPRVMLYGLQGIGKNTWAAGTPHPIVIQTEEGSDEIGIDRLPLCRTYVDVLAQIGALCTEQHTYQTVIIDTLDWMEKLIWADVCVKHGAPSIEQVLKGFGKGYVAALDWWRQILDGLRYLRDERGMIVVLLAHSSIKRFDSPETEPYDRYQPRLNHSAAGMVMEWCDTVLFANYKTFTVKTDVGFDKDVRRAIGMGERTLYTCERPSHHAKNRYGLPPELPFPKEGGWAVFTNAIASSVPPASPTPPTPEPASAPAPVASTTTAA